MYTVTCPQSGMSTVVACACHQVGHDAAAAGAHHERCQMNNLTSNLACPPEAGCCQEAHDHEATANACPGGHGDCPVPDDCRLWGSVLAHHAAAKAAHAEHGGGPDHFAASMVEPPDACPGG